MSMKVKTGSFLKKDGTHRHMRFVSTQDIPQETLQSLSKGGRKPTLIEGGELVWDLEANGFRSFNHLTVVSPVVETGETIDSL